MKNKRKTSIKKQMGGEEKIYDNGNEYEGHLEHTGERHGQGKMKYANRNVYEGNWDMDDRHGKGKMEYANGDVYDGDWFYDERRGKGKMIYKNNDVYEGNWFKNRKSGQGKMKYKNGDVYEGNWAIDDNMHGQGKMEYANGDVYDGEWYTGHMIKGKMEYANGDVYEGEWLLNKKSGQGKMKYKNGDVYDGVWVNDRPETEEEKAKRQAQEEEEEERAKTLKERAKKRAEQEREKKQAEPEKTSKTRKIREEPIIPKHEKCPAKYYTDDYINSCVSVKEEDREKEYRKISRFLHPDKNKCEGQEDEKGRKNDDIPNEKMKELNKTKCIPQNKGGKTYKKNSQKNKTKRKSHN